MRALFLRIKRFVLQCKITIRFTYTFHELFPKEDTEMYRRIKDLREDHDLYQKDLAQ